LYDQYCRFVDRFLTKDPLDHEFNPPPRAKADCHQDDTEGSSGQAFSKMLSFEFSEQKVEFLSSA